MSRLLSAEVNDRLAANVDRRIDKLIQNRQGLPSGKGKRTSLSPADTRKLKSALVDAVGHASVSALNGPLPNRTAGRGRPPDNAVFIFIDDIVRACEAVGLKPGLRYISGSESFPVQIFIELAPLLWGPVRAPRRLFERWKRYRSDLSRFPED